MVTKNRGMLVLGIYLIIVGAVSVFGLTFAYMGLVLGVLAIVAGALILMGQ